MQDIILIGLNHKSASVSVRECLAFSDQEARSALVELRARKIVDEAMLFFHVQPGGAVDGSKRE